jgi:hypothetical protein
MLSLQAIDWDAVHQDPWRVLATQGKAKNDGLRLTWPNCDAPAN